MTQSNKPTRFAPTTEEQVKELIDGAVTVCCWRQREWDNPPIPLLHLRNPAPEIADLPRALVSDGGSTGTWDAAGKWIVAPNVLGGTPGDLGIPAVLEVIIDRPITLCLRIYTPANRAHRPMLEEMLAYDSFGLVVSNDCPTYTDRWDALVPVIMSLPPSPELEATLNALRGGG